MTNVPANHKIFSKRLDAKIAYRDADGTQLGLEHLDISSHAGGHIMRALCVLDYVDLVRDVTLTMEPDYRPIEGYCRLTRGGKNLAAYTFHVEQDGVYVDSQLDGVRQERTFVPTETHIGYLGLHPVQGDALIVEERGTDRPGEFVPIETVTYSISPNGDEDLNLVRMTIDTAFIGYEELTVTGGTFKARHYQLRWAPEWPPADVWVREEDCLFLKLSWSLIPVWYELISLTEEK